MRVGDDAAQLVEGVVEVVHATSFSGVDVEPDSLALAVLGLATDANAEVWTLLQ